MATPVGHGIVGLTVAHGAGREPGDRTPALYLLSAFAAVAPDLDFLPGLLEGTPNLYHWSVSHSLGAAVVFSAVVAAVTSLRGGTPRTARTVGWIAGLSYVSHLLLDVLGRDDRPLSGQPLLWPVSSEPLASPGGFLPSIEHSGASDSLGDFLTAVISWENLLAVSVEVAILLPPCLAVAWWMRRARGSGTR